MLSLQSPGAKSPGVIDKPVTPIVVSSIVIPFTLTLPLLVTVKVYSIVSPASTNPLPFASTTPPLTFSKSKFGSASKNPSLGSTTVAPLTTVVVVGSVPAV